MGSMALTISKQGQSLPDVVMQELIDENTLTKLYIVNYICVA